MSKDILQLIGNYLDTCEFCRLKNAYGLSSNVYIKNLNIFNDISADDDHEFMDELILQNRLSEGRVITYALKYDIAKYITLSNFGIFAEYKGSFVFLPKNVIFAKPQIVEHNYKYHGFRFGNKFFDDIFETNNVPLMKIMQQYPQKSNISVRDYHIRQHKDLWQLNYKHKMAHIFAKHRTKSCFIMTFVNSCFATALINSRVASHMLNMDGFVNGCMLGALCLVVVLLPYYICDAFRDLKLPL